jgi:phosphatidylserine/phosphatidylglycerophosphate/cardiolipin synthase-like enzyme
MGQSRDLTKAVYDLVKDLPPELAETLAARLERYGQNSHQELEALASSFPQPNVAQHVRKCLLLWQELAPEFPAEGLALAIRAASWAVSETRRSQQIEFVWTGPDSLAIPIRRTEQALLQVTRDARHSLHIVSFAVYRAENIVRELVAALDRGVQVAIYLETPDASQGKVAFDPIGALGAELAQRASLFVWPLEKRVLSGAGGHGSLHAKLALADGHRLLISSANLTQYAMTLNMESGLLVTGGDIPEKVGRHLAYLVETGVFELL